MPGYYPPGELKSRECQSAERGERGRDVERSRNKRQRQNIIGSIPLHILVTFCIAFSSFCETFQYSYSSLYRPLKLT